MAITSNARYGFNVPEEIMLLILDHLELHDWFLLSLTCKFMRRLIGKDWGSELEAMDREEKLDFLAGIVYALPDRWACGQCCRLHRVDPQDVPYANQSRCRDNKTRNTYGSYDLQHHHIQLALKYKRLGYDHALEQLLRPYNEDFGVEKTPLKRYVAEPKIKGNEFLLREIWVLNPSVSFKADPPWPTANIQVCAHMTLSGTEMEWGGRGTRWVITVDGFGERLFIFMWERSPQKQYRCYCSRCMTSLSVDMDDARRLVAQAWHNYGSFSSPGDVAWTDHLREAQSTFRTRMRVWPAYC